MSKLFEFLNSSVGRKWLMALTGLFLCLFVLVHMAGNLALFKNDAGKSFNEYAVFMTTFPLIKAISYVNYLLILVHALNGFYLVFRNKKARPIKYEGAKNNMNVSWSSRNMGILGTILFVFIVFHMNQFWRAFHWSPMEITRYVTNINTGETFTENVPYAEFTVAKHYSINGFEIFEGKNLYADVAEDFKNPIYVILYLVAMIALSYHLAHGFQSAFQTLGIRTKNYTTIIKTVGNIFFAVIIPALFAAMPIYFLLFKH